MAKRFQQTLFIARSKESADLYLKHNTGAIKAVTLSSFLSSFNESEKTVLDPFLGKLYLKQVIASLDLKHFDYLVSAEESLSDLYQHLLACKRNDVTLQSFGYSPMKLKELEAIAQAYESSKQSDGFMDSADLLIVTVENLKNNGYFDQFQRIVIDNFKEDGINFCTSKVEEEALAIIKSFSQTVTQEQQKASSKMPATFTLQNSYFDEALFSLKAVRTLMENGMSDRNIAIVTGNLNEYRRILDSYAPKYGIALQFSSGTPMLQSPLYDKYILSRGFEDFKKNYKAKLTNDYDARDIDETELEKQKRHFVQIKNLENETLFYIKRAKELLGIDLDQKAIAKELAEEMHVPPSKEQKGVIVTEPNQMTLREFDHVIFIGTDLSQFPPKSKGNFLATSKQREELLYFNNTYELSTYYYRKLCSNSGNLHLSMASYSGKKKLFLSPIIDEVSDNDFAINDIVSEREYLLSNKRYRLETNDESYISSMISTRLTSYDGSICNQSFEVGSLSASALNTYAKCPLRYLLKHQYQCDPIALEQDEEAFDATDIGTIFHSIAEVFANKVKEGDIVLGDQITSDIKNRIELITREEFAKYLQEHVVDEDKKVTIFHQIVLNDLLKGLHDEHHQKGLVIRFLEYVYAEGSLEHFLESERFFMLDDSFEITEDKSKAMIRGFIDRIDHNKATNHVSIIDYKTGKYRKETEKKLLEGMQEYTQFQLPLYLLYAKRAFKECSIDAFLVSFKNGDGVKAYAHISSENEEGVLFDDNYEKGLIHTIQTIKKDVESGAFAMTPSDDNCEYCDFERICHKSVQPWKEQHEQV